MVVSVALIVGENKAGKTVTAAPTVQKKRKLAPDSPDKPRWNDMDFVVSPEEYSKATAPTQNVLPPNFMQRLGMTPLRLPDITEYSYQPSEPEKKATDLETMTKGLKYAATGSTKNMNPAFAGALAQVNAAMKASGLGTFKVVSGYRTFEQQADLYQKWLRGEGNLAAKPTGKSSHEVGNAVDINWSQLNAKQQAWLRENLPKYGIQPPSWSFHYNTEPWHWQWYGEGGY